MGGDEFDYSDEYDDDGKPGTVRTRVAASPARSHVARLSTLASVAPIHVHFLRFCAEARFRCANSAHSN